MIGLQLDSSTPISTDVKPPSGFRRGARWIVVSVLVAAVLVLFLYGTMRQAMRVNNHHDDQDAFIEYTLALVKDPTYIDGARTPLFPLLVRLFYHEGMSEEALFWQGVAVGIGVSIICVAALALFFFRAFPVSLALPLTLLVTLNIYVIIAPYYKPEPLFYALLFFAFVLMCRAFRRLTVPLAISIGLLLGLATLAKASATSALAIFIAVKGLQLVVEAVRSRRGWRPLLTSVGVLALAAVVFLVVISGYVASSRRIFGATFYNVNTTFYMWYDTYDQVRTGTRQHYDRTGWPRMPPEQIPSMSKYLSTHSPEEIAHRLVDGLPAVVADHCGEDFDTITTHCKYVGALGVIAIALVVMNLPWVGSLIRRHGFLILFCLLFLASFVLSASWWRPLSKGQRFSMPVVLPILYLLASFIALPQLRRLRLILFGRRIDLITVALALMTVAIALDSITTLTWRVLRVRGAN